MHRASYLKLIETGELGARVEQLMNMLASCRVCPRDCDVDRLNDEVAACYSGLLPIVSAYTPHFGEETALVGTGGAGNVFMGLCNLRCVYCQNHQISQPCSWKADKESDPEHAIRKIAGIIASGISAVGFVSPSHMIPQMKYIINELRSRGLNPVFVYNTNGFDKRETIRSLEGMIDVYLPDFKYVSGEVSSGMSDSASYCHFALGALKEMYYQKGSTLITDDNGRAVNGVLIRHLVLPGHVEESKKVLDTIADELSTGVHISLMSQYHPVAAVRNHALLNRPLYKSEYDEVAAYMQELGFRNGYIQEMDSFQNYLPDFDKEHPFE